MSDETGRSVNQKHVIDDTEDPWDALCVDPHGQFIEQGRREGAAAGRRKGYDTGYSLGRTTAIDVGLELGFIEGFVALIVGDNEAVAVDICDRARRTAQELMQLVENFPGVDEVFQEQERERQRQASHQQDDDAVNGDSEQIPPSGVRNVRTEIQRIRAKFKQLTVQLGCSDCSLKHIMDSTAAASSGDSPASIDF